MAKYSIGIDFGSLSGRAVLLDLESKELVAQAEKPYTHAVMDTCLPDGTRLGADWALQVPHDYIEVLEETVPAVIRESGIDSKDVIGIGIDFTACTVLPVYRDGTPLCEVPEWEHHPHAYVKLWKHHAAQDQANRLNALAEERGEAFLARYGGKISSEWMIPKLMQIAEEAPEIYEAMDRFIEATDWVVWQLCGREVRNNCTAGYKAIWNKKDGYPSEEFFKALHPLMEHVVDEKLSRDIVPIGTRAGDLTQEMAKRIGLPAGIAVAVGNVDAHVAIPAVGITGPGKLLMIIGTSTCDIIVGEREATVPGMCGIVEDGVLPGYFGYEAGQSCVGDGFNWFVKESASGRIGAEAAERGIGIHQLLTERAEKLRPGESGLLALDWLNGNRSVLVDVDLTGMMLGMNLQTKPEELYRAWIEATAYGTRMIVETFQANGVSIDELYACGGIAWKNPMMMQIYADVMNRPVKISATDQTPALGAAIFGAVAAGAEAGGYDDVASAAMDIGKVRDDVYHPIPEHVGIYEQLYREYEMLHDYFGRGTNDVMKRLKALRRKQSTSGEKEGTDV